MKELINSADECIKLCNLAKSLEYGSQEQVDADNSACIMFEELSTPREFNNFENYAHRATPDERIDYILNAFDPNKPAPEKTTMGVCVTPRIGVDVDTTGLDEDWNLWSNDSSECDTLLILERAITQVREMDADALKKLVIEGLIDADGYPRDFAEY